MRITVAGLTKRIEEIHATAERLRDLTPAMQAAASAVTKGISDRFRSATDWDGQPWQPLAASTVANRRKGSKRILQDTGVLKNSITATAGKRSLTFGTITPYAGIHQFGGNAGRGGRSVIARRSFLPVAKAGGKFTFASGAPAQVLLARIRKYLTDYILRGTGAAPVA